jgi:predicted lipoprotein
MFAPASSAAARIRRQAAGFAAALILTLLALAAALGKADAQEDAVRPPVVRSEADYAKLVATILEAHVRPAYERFGRDADLLASEVDGLCEAPSLEALASTRRILESAARSYFALMPVRFGPILEANRQERLAFWPDPRGLGLKQVQKLLAEADPTAADPASLARKSVGVQGLTALEFLLYGTGSEVLQAGGEDYRCRYAAAIAANVRTIAAEMSAAWEEGGAATALWTEPGPSNPLFQTHKEAAGKILNTAAAGIEVVVDSMIAAPFGESEDRARPKVAPFWRSNQSMPAAASALEATQHLLEVSGVFAMLSPHDEWLGNSIVFEIRNAGEGVRSIVAPVEAAVQDETSRETIRYVEVALHSLKRAVGRELSSAIGLEQGFNANDGD